MKRLQIVLAIAGTAAMIAGTLIAVVNLTSAATINQSDPAAHENVVYVGTSTCYTCHGDTQSDGWHALHPQVIQNPVATPQVILADLNEFQTVRQVKTGRETRAYTAGVATSVINGSPVQRYIMKTEDGDSLLPGMWIMITADDTLEAESTEWLESCAGCHGPAGKHIRLAEQLVPGANTETLEAVRGAITMTASSANCAGCHDGGNRSNMEDLPIISTTMPASTWLAGNTKSDKQHFLVLQAVLRGTPTAHPTYRGEDPIR